MRLIGALLAWLVPTAALAANDPVFNTIRGDGSQLTVKATDGVVGFADASRAARELNVLDYGAKCDGGSHPLSGAYGTLAAAQAVYPAATALTDELDGVAIQRAVNRAGSLGGARVSLPQGTCLISGGITVSSGKIFVEGKGIQATAVVSKSASSDVFSVHGIIF